jgi:hypothetical protein
MDFLFADFVFWDMPFGLNLAPWDKLLDDLELSIFFKQLSTVNTSKSTVIALPWWFISLILAESRR